MAGKISDVEFWAHEFDLQTLKQCEKTLTDPFGSGLTRKGLVELKEIIRLYEIPILEQPDSYPDSPEPYSPISEVEPETRSENNYDGDCSASNTENNSESTCDSPSDFETDPSSFESSGPEEEPADAKRTVATQTDYRYQSRDTDCTCF